MQESAPTTFGSGGEPYPRQAIYPAWSSTQAPPAEIAVETYSTPEELSAALVGAVQRGNLDKVKQLVEQHNYDVNTPDKEDCSFLQWAALNNHIPCMQYLIDHGANVNFVGGELRATPLHWATFMGNLAAVVCLIQNGADATIVNRDGCTPLHFAAQRGFSHIVAYLLGKGMDVNMRDQFGMTPLMWATKVSATDPCRLLISMGSDLTLKDRVHGNTALHWAVLNTNISACQLLLSHGADIDAVSGSNKTPLALSLTDKRNRYVEDVLRTHRQEKGLEGSWMTRNVVRNESLIRTIFYVIPFITFIFMGLVLMSNWNYLVKLVVIVVYSVITFYIGKWLHFFRFSDQFPLAVYVGCKICVIATIFIVWIPAIATFWNVTVWLVLFTGLWYNFLRTWLGDPGILNPAKEDKLKAVVELAEKNEFSVHKLCTTCLVVRPIRSKHCSICGKCIDTMDHHCPFTGNCIGRKNHRFFIGYLFFLSLAGIWAIYAGFIYAGLACGLSSQNFLLTIGHTLQCAPWSMYTLLFSMGFTFWVACLTAMQVYQIFMISMTTNERLNQHRYKHFHGEDGDHVNPFKRGFLQNCLDFFECELFGLRTRLNKTQPYQPLKTDNV